MSAPIRLHVDVLGWLHLIWGSFGLLTGAALLLLAAGMRAALWTQPEAGPAEDAAVWILLVCGVILAGGGTAMALVGRALGRRQPTARLLVLLLALPNLVFVPFGTALAIYACWVLLNDEARGQFGRAPRMFAAPELRADFDEAQAAPSDSRRAERAPSEGGAAPSRSRSIREP